MACLSDEEILERVPLWTSPDTDPTERAGAGEFLVDYCRGQVAESAVRAIVDALPGDELERLVAKHVVRWHFASDKPSYCRHPPTVAQRLVDFGFGPVRTTPEGWLVGWPDGEQFTGQDLCPLALLAVWVRRMRDTDPVESAPAY